MAFNRNSEDSGSEAAEPLYRQSGEHPEKTRPHEIYHETAALQASLRKIRRWLIAVSVLLGLACAYIAFSSAGTVRNRFASKRLSFAPQSK